MRVYVPGEEHAWNLMEIGKYFVASEIEKEHSKIK